MSTTEQWGERKQVQGKPAKSGRSFLFWRKERLDQYAMPEAEGIRSLLVSVDSANITVSRTFGGSSIGIRLTGWARQYSAEEFGIETFREGDQLHIGIREPIGQGGIMNWGPLELKLEVELPAKEWEWIRLKSGSGNLKASQIAAKSVVIESGSGSLMVTDMKVEQLLRLHTGSGDVTAERLTADESSIHTNSGNLTVEDLRIEQRLELNTSSGNINAARIEALYSSIYSGSGNIMLKDGSTSVQAESGSGNIRMDRLLMTGNSELWTGSGNIDVHLASGNHDVAVTCSTGAGNGHISGNGFIMTERTDDSSCMAGRFGDGSFKLQIRTGSGNYALHKG